ncbi:MAG: hypothetical protein M5U34_07550 [Chloroflexi bacterium]|nr:hypothetical protein [Chloroflexota bacterium]
MKTNDEAGRTKQLYKQVVIELEDDEMAVLDAGFGLVQAVEANMLRCLIRLAKNITFGATAGKIPERTSDKGPAPSQYKAEIVRPLERKHGDKTLPTKADETIRSRMKKGEKSLFISGTNYIFWNVN